MAKRSKALLQIRGANQLRRTLKQAGDDLNNLKSAHQQAAKVAEAAAKRGTPVRTGRLKASIRTSATKRDARIRAGNNRTSKTGVPYANPIHWGWPKHRIKPNPWILEAGRKTEPQWVAIYEKALIDAVNKVKGI